MGHSRIKMELIKKESTRMLTYQKRKKSLEKKVSEFSILCGVEACLVIFGPKLKNQYSNKPDAVWPLNSDEARNIIGKYKETDQAKRCYSVSDYFSEKKKKLDAEIFKLHKQVFQAKFPSWNVRLDSSSEDELRLLVTLLENRIEAADQRLNSFQANQNDRIEMLAPRMVYDTHNFQGFPDLMKDVQIPPIYWQNPYMIPLNSNFQLFPDTHSTISGRNLMDNNSSSSSSNNLQLQLFAPKPLDVQVPMYFQNQGMSLNSNVMEDVMAKMSNNQNFSNQFGGRGILNHIPSFSGLPYAANPQFLVPDNVRLNHFDASMPLQTMLPQSRNQPPMSSLQNQVHFPQADKFSFYDIGIPKAER
ncbi:floral homeotic protein GLOBOSA-like [Mercurialis annua]|uniref:floral homeotic protein GLOBOSA-like n=1 Tax=Mercurialis annua TaxID=3986 RepID=UPI00215E77FD|nr:floral homeotic protein GLOBOSA-like [Mercurialis annua]